jgi:flagellar protein FliO/FliZ
MESFLMSFLSMLVALAVVLALAWFALRFLRTRMQGGASSNGAAGPGDALKFVRALGVGTKERVVIVEHRGERWMLGVTAGGISTIAHWPPERGAGAPTK